MNVLPFSLSSLALFPTLSLSISHLLSACGGCLGLFFVGQFLFFFNSVFEQCPNKMGFKSLFLSLSLCLLA